MKPTESDNDLQAGLIARKSTVALPSSFRWVVLIVICFCVFALTYCYDNPFALQNQLADKYNLNPVQYNMFYSVYGYVNVITPLLSGICIDYIGINSSSILFYLLIVLGQFCWIFGCYSESYPIMLLGRGLFGCGSQPFHTSRKYYSFEYFQGKEYSFASGMSVFAARLASASQSYITTFIYDATQSIVISLGVGGILTVVAFLVLCVFVLYMKCAKAKLQGIQIGLQTFSIPHILYRRYQRRQNKNINDSSEPTRATPEKSKFNLNGLWNGAYDRRFTIMTLLLITFYPSYLSFTNIGSSFLQSKFDYSYDEANSLITTPLWISAVCIPIFGFVCDKYGQRCPLLTLSAILLIIAHLLLGFTDETSHYVLPIAGLITFGFGMAIGSSILWPSIALICSKQYLATALGFIGCVDNAVQATSYLIVGMLTKSYADHNHHRRDQYEYVTYWVVGLAVMMFVFSLMLWYYDATMFDNRLSRREAKFERNVEALSEMNFSRISGYSDEEDRGSDVADRTAMAT